MAGGRFGRMSGLRCEEQNSDYEAGVVMLDDSLWRLRTARVTPTKPGAFVAAWKRDESGGTTPFTEHDEALGLMVFVRDDEQFGVFRFTNPHLLKLGVLASATSTGKRGFRVYPSWSAGLNPQASRTQHRQSEAFIRLA